MPRKTTAPGANYLNVDLEIRSSADLKPLADAVSTHLDIIHLGRVRNEFFLSVEVPGRTQPPDAAIAILAKTILSLPPSVRRHWQRARDRVFDIGLVKTIQAGAYALAVHPETLKTVAKLNARLAITIYSPAIGRPRKLSSSSVSNRVVK